VTKRSIVLCAAVLLLAPRALLAQSGLVFRDGFETGNLASWSASATDGGDLSVSALAAMAGTGSGLRAVVNDLNPLYVEDDTPNDMIFYRARFWLDPTGFDPGEAQAHFRVRVFIVFEEAPTRRLAAVVLKRQGGQYALMARARIDTDAQVSSAFVPITAAPHMVEVQWKRSTGVDTSDGELRFWIDGAPAGVLTGLDDDRSTVDFVRLGALSLKSGASGTLAWDEFRSYDAAALPRAQVLINEFNANIANTCDLLELRVTGSGSLEDYVLRERTATVLTLGPLNVTTNDLVVVHLSGTTPACNPGSSPSESSAKAEYPAVTYAANYDTAWDWYSSRAGLSNTDTVLTVSDDAGRIQDAVLAANAPTGTASTASETEAAIVAAAGQWQRPGGGVPPGGFVDTDFRANAVLDLDATGASATGNSIQRTSNVDSNDLNGWTSGSGVPASFGVFNAGQTPCCAATVHDIQTGIVAVGAPVVLSNLVVTALTANGRSFWVADALTAAASSGVFVFRSDVTPVPFAIGALVNLTGTVAEFQNGAGDTLTEIVFGSVVEVGSAGVPVPLAADAGTLSSIPDGEPYEGVLVQITNVKVTSQLPFDQLVLTDNGGHTIVMDDVAFDYSNSSFPLTTCFGSVTGVMSVDVFNDIRVILPRGAIDLGPGGACN
jgi:hypothetical protein